MLNWSAHSSSKRCNDCHHLSSVWSPLSRVGFPSWLCPVAIPFPAIAAKIISDSCRWLELDQVQVRVSGCQPFHSQEKCPSDLWCLGTRTNLVHKNLLLSPLHMQSSLDILYPEFRIIITIITIQTIIKIIIIHNKNNSKYGNYFCQSEEKLWYLFLMNVINSSCCSSLPESRSRIVPP